RPRVVNDVLHPAMIGSLFHPKDAIVVRGARDEVIPSIAVDVQHIDKAGRAEIKLRMPRPLARARITRSFEPAFRSNDIRAPVSVHVACTDAVAITAIADNMLHKLAGSDFEPG